MRLLAIAAAALLLQFSTAPIYKDGWIDFNKNGRKDPYEDPAVPTDRRIEDFTNEGIRGLNHDRATSFPAQLGIASAWDRDLVRQVGTITAREARALGYTNVYSPILDLPRDPRWGRTVEA